MSPSQGCNACSTPRCWGTLAPAAGPTPSSDPSVLDTQSAWLSSIPPTWRTKVRRTLTRLQVPGKALDQDGSPCWTAPTGLGRVPPATSRERCVLLEGRSAGEFQRLDQV